MTSTLPNAVDAVDTVAGPVGALVTASAHELLACARATVRTLLAWLTAPTGTLAPRTTAIANVRLATARLRMDNMSDLHL